MNFIINVFISALLFYYYKEDKNINKIYRFAKVQKNSNNYDLNNINRIQSDNIIIDILFKIYFLNKDYN